MLISYTARDVFLQCRHLFTKLREFTTKMTKLKQGKKTRRQLILNLHGMTTKNESDIL